MKKHPLADLDADIRDHIERETRGQHRARHVAGGRALRGASEVRECRADARRHARRVDSGPPRAIYSRRSLRAALAAPVPGFSIAAIVMLTIGLGLVAGGYTVFNGLFIRGWAVPDNAQVFRVHGERVAAPTSGYVSDGFTRGSYQYIRDSAKSADYVAFTIDYFRVRADAGTGGTHTPAMFVSDNFIEALRIPLQRGAGFGGVPRASEPRALISDGVWRRHFAADPQIVGRTMWLTGVATTIVGVTARGFDGLAERPLDVIVDMSSRSVWGSQRSGATLMADGTTGVTLAGRMRKGWSHAQCARSSIVLPHSIGSRLASRLFR